MIYMEEINLIKVREIQLNILNEVKEFCENNGIQYFLVGGTLLGAIRHKGYIPWDDDIDIAMKRKDYEKFISHFNLYNSMYKVHSITTDKNYKYPFAKVSYVKSILIENEITRSENLGVNIDVFPIDNIPSETDLRQKYVKKITLCRRIFYIKNLSWNNNLPLIKNVIIYLGKIIFLFHSTMKLVMRIDKIARQYENNITPNMGVMVWGYGECEILPSNVFANIENVEFEGKPFSIPIGYHEYLTSIYKEYMKLPPLEKQKSHHNFKAYIF
jgi:lipopolysaccharide cholinephosphotransferase